MIETISNSEVWTRMDYRNTEMKLDQLVGYFNEEKINLSPIFQRGRVWTLPMRQELVKNIVRHRPIPAVFLYKDEAGAKYSYSILDGKQRLESLIMFIGYANPHLSIKTWGDYIFGQEDRKAVGFAVDLKDGKGARKFADFDESDIRDLREYTIPTIEIVLNENTSLDEIINLFVDINQRGAKVTRLNIVRALRQKDPLMQDVYALIAVKQQRRQDVHTKKKATPYVSVLKKLNVISSVGDNSVQADRMWERLLELALFVRSEGKDRKPSEILKTFIKDSDSNEYYKLKREEKAVLRKTFAFLETAYKNAELRGSRLATDQTHFYTMVTALLNSDLIDRYQTADLTSKLVKFSKLLGHPTSGGHDPLSRAVDTYKNLSAEKTTDASRRKTRRQKLIEAVDLL